MLFHKQIKTSQPIKFSTSEDLCEFIKKENPHEGIKEEEKMIINKVGTNLNNAIRNGGKLPQELQSEIDLIQRLIKNHVLKESIIVNRGVQSIEYELTLARNKGMSNKFLFHNGFVYTSLLDAYHRQIHLNILIPAGTSYLYTGVFSNTFGPYTPENETMNNDKVGELILDIGTILKIDRKRECGGITIYDVHVE